MVILLFYRIDKHAPADPDIGKFHSPPDLHVMT
jgi:hypothetical protein